MSDSNLLHETRQRAREIVLRCATPLGFRASGLAAGYPDPQHRNHEQQGGAG